MKGKGKGQQRGGRGGGDGEREDTAPPMEIPGYAAEYRRLRHSLVDSRRSRHIDTLAQSTADKHIARSLP
jgi:hypothetical protein